MGYIIRTDDGDELRTHMRSNMRGGMYRHDGYSPMMRGDSEKEHWYRMGYRHGWEDSEDDMEETHMRRGRDSRGRYI